MENATNKRLILLELNELSHVLLFEYMERGYLPNFKRLYDQSQAFLTDARASGENLNPWIQWVSVHTGIKAEQHGVYYLNDLDGFSGEFVWDTLAKNGYHSWVCGSMNAKVSSDFEGLFLPDPWSTDATPYPAGKFESFFNFVRQSVLGHSASKKVAARDFVLYLFRNGLSVKTFLKIAKQLVMEKIKPDIKWRRAMLLDWLQLDLFKYHHRQARPSLSVFFSNSTAHFQHHYWPETEFASHTEGGHEENRLLAAYINHDRLLEEFIKLQDQDTAIMFCTALSQERFNAEIRNYYHIKNQKTFLKGFGIDKEVEYEPVMAEQFHLACQSATEAEELRAQLRNFEMKSENFFHRGSKRVLSAVVSDKKVLIKCRCSRPVDPDDEIVNIQNGATLRFGDIFYQMSDIKTGVHNPTGMLWLAGDHTWLVPPGETLELEAVKPMILEYFSVAAA